MKKVLNVFSKYVGYLEKKSNAQLEDFTANAGSNNYTIFGKRYEEYMNVQGFVNAAWCAMFVSCGFVEAYGLETAKKMLYGDLFAYCPYGLEQFRRKNKLYNTPQKGDIVFFLRNGVARHTGIVYDVTKNSICTIEGNTSGASGVVANGGGVKKKAYVLNDNMVFGRPNYSLVNADTATKETQPKQTKTDFIKAVQKAIGVVDDGIVGSKTRAALPLLKKGNKGTAVKAVQRGLMDVYGISLPKYGADGDFGAETVAAVKTFQSANGLVSDGIIGAKTWKKLLE